MKLRITPTVVKLKENKPVHSLIPSPRTGIVPPVEHRWKKGQSGNYNGRPRIIRSAYEKRLMKIVMVEDDFVEGDAPVAKKVKMTVADAIAKNLADTAMTSVKYGVGAAQELRKVVEPDTEEEPTDRGNFDVAREVLTLMIERGKHM